MFLTKDELTNLIKQINQKYYLKADLTSLEFEAFQKFLVQVSAYLYQGKVKDLRRMPAGYMLEELMKQFSAVCKKRGDNN